jgi:glutathione synthase/RimK-type ligase-like ATP-grasp enzyme
VSAPVVTVLTSQPAHSTLRALVDVGAQKGVTIRCAPRVDAASALVFQWSYARPIALAAVRQFCAHHRIEHLNAEPLGKWEQLVRLADAGIPIPESRRAPTLPAAREAAALLGYPVVIKPNWGLKSLGVELVADEAALEAAWTPSHRIVQSYLPEGGRCARILVIGERALSAITRVANDGFHATYDHGRRGTLEPYPLLAEREALAVAACRAVGVEVAGVDLVETGRGPCVLEVNHVRVEFGDRELHGPHAVASVAAWLAERARLRTPPSPAPPRASRVRIVTRHPADPALPHLMQACRNEGLVPEVAATVDPAADATWFWRVSPAQHQLGMARVRALAMPLVNGHAEMPSRDRALLFRAGVPVPRSRVAQGLGEALDVARELGYPLVVRGGVARRGVTVRDAAALTAAWPADEQARRTLELQRYATAPRVRIWVAAERAFFARRTARGRTRPTPLRLAPCEVAIAACRLLGVDAGFVDVVIVDGQPAVQRVVARSRWIGRLSATSRGVALTALAGALRERLVAPPQPARRPPAARRLTVLLARDFDDLGSGQRIGNIQELARELARRGHRMLSLEGRFDRALVEGADLVLQDPVHAFGVGTRSDELDRLLCQHAAERCHLLRHQREGTIDKRAMHAVAVALGVRTPAIYDRAEVTKAELPLVAKPRRGSLGIGVRRVTTLRQLERLPSRGILLQQLVDANAESVVSIRVVTVVDRVVAAALFHNAGSICSNLAQGGRAIPLTGPGRQLHLTVAEQALLERVGIDPHRRELPAGVAQMAGTIGRHHARRGVQMIGQDFVVDGAQLWYFLELNLGFGTAVFNATDGEGFPSSGRGLAHAGRVLADAIEERFARGGASER